MNAVHLIGRLVKEINLEKKGETTFARFTLAVQRNKNITDFVDCVAFGKTAEFLQAHVNKGERIAATGRIETNIYDGKDGGSRKSVTVNISNAECFSFSKSENTEAPEEKSDEENDHDQ